MGGPAARHLAAGVFASTLLLLGPLPPAAAQSDPHPSAGNPPIVLPNNPVQALFVQGSGKAKVYMLVGAGPGNITLQIGDEGVLVVDTGSLPMSGQTLAAIKHLMAGLTDQPIRWIINTHFHSDNTGGNAALSKAGEQLVENSIGTIPLFGKQNEVQPATIIAHENVLKRMSAPTGSQAPTPVAAWPLMTFFTLKKNVAFNYEPIELIHVPAAHTDGDSLVFFRHSDVVSTGGAFVTTTYPVLDLKAGGTINGSIDALNLIIDIAVPHDHQEGGTYVIPGEGRLCDQADVVEYRNMVVIVRDRVQYMMNKGMSLEQVKAARPTADYDARYATREWTADMFVEAVYQTLMPGAYRQNTPSSKVP